MAGRAIESRGKVAQILPKGLYRIQLIDGHRVIAHVSGEKQVEITRLLVGDRVTVEIFQTDLSRGKIVEHIV